MTTVRVLGCSGGIGDRLGEGMSRTTALLIDDDVLVDCGTGVGDMNLINWRRFDHVFLTHAHLDHIAGLPLLIDTVCDIRSTPLQVYAPAETIDALQRHIFNWAICRFQQAVGASTTDAQLCGHFGGGRQSPFPAGR